MVIWMIRGTGHSQSSGAFQPVEKTTKKSYPGHLKMMQDLKAARAKIDVHLTYFTEAEKGFHQKPSECEGERTARAV